MIGVQTTVLDYGCGQGDDVRQLCGQGIRAIGWDPFYSPRQERTPSDIVNLGYVVNVIEDVAERAKVLQDAWSYTTKLLIVSARLTVDDKSDFEFPYFDGHLTRLGTFQKLFEQQELKQWIESTIGESCVAAAPGVFYAFRDANLRYAYLTARLRTVSVRPKQDQPDEIFEAHKQSFEELIGFFLARGRLPVNEEMPSLAPLCQQVGGIRRAFAIVRRVMGSTHWDKISAERAQDLLVYLALARFTRRPKFTVLPLALQLDLRAFFSSYKNACEVADSLLFSAGKRELIEQACRNSPIGKLTPTSLYVHETALETLDPILRVYEGCARALVGAVDRANIIKLRFVEPIVSYLSYPTFENEAHPALASSLLVHLQTFSMRFRQYSGSANPPILHRKEEFIRLDDPSRPKFERLTRQEEAKGLYDRPSEIGTLERWQAMLVSKNLRLVGHRLCRTLTSTL